jgi:single-stranded DNA-binding protein
MNLQVITGNLGQDPRAIAYRDADGVDQQMCTFSVAVNRPRRRDGSQVEPDWFQVKVWNPGIAGSCLKFLKAGRRVGVQGQTRFDRYEHKTLKNEDGTPFMVPTVELRADVVEFLDTPPEGSGPANGQAQPQAAAPAAGGEVKMPF